MKIDIHELRPMGSSMRYRKLSLPIGFHRLLLYSGWLVASSASRCGLHRAAATFPLVLTLWPC